MALLLTDELDSRAIYRLLVGTIQPRPIAFVSTVDTEGAPNIAPFSFFNVASVDPPILAFAPLRAPLPDADESRPKDTLLNLRETGECVVHVVSYDLREAMNRSSGSWPKSVSEFDVTGLTPIPSERVRAPRAAEAAVAYECRLDQLISWGDRPRAGTLVLVRVLAIHIDDALLSDGKVDQRALDTIGRMGGPAYTRSRDGYFEMMRPTEEDIRRALGSDGSA